MGRPHQSDRKGMPLVGSRRPSDATRFDSRRWLDGLRDDSSSSIAAVRERRSMAKRCRTRREDSLVASRTDARGRQRLVAAVGRVFSVVGPRRVLQAQASFSTIPEAHRPVGPRPVGVDGVQGLNRRLDIRIRSLRPRGCGTGRTLAAMSRQRSVNIVASCSPQREEQP